MNIDRFIFSLILSIILAFLAPGGAELLHIKQLTTVGVGLIFFFYGLKLSFDEVVRGLKRYQLHIIIQLSTFLLFPLVVLLFKPILIRFVGENFWIGLFFLAALPSTVSSSVVLVSLARGNVPCAIFNASVSGLIGTFLTPVWIGLFASQPGELSLGGVFLKLFFQILLPLVLGLLLNAKYGFVVKKNSQKFAAFDKMIILLIVYSSFCTSMLSKIFDTVSWFQLFCLFAVVLCLFWMVIGFLYFIALRFHLSLADRITVTFCGTKKSLVHGSAMIDIIFKSSVHASLYLLPVMLYHITQLFIISSLASKIRKSTP